MPSGSLPSRAHASTLNSLFNPLHLGLLSLRLRLLTQRPTLDHERDDLIQHIRRRHGGQLGISIVRGRDLNDIRGDEIHALETSYDRPEFAGAPAAGLGGAGGGGEGGVEGVDVDGEVDGGVLGEAGFDGVDDAGGADGVDVAGFDAREAAVAVVGVVGQAGERGADAGVHVGVVGQQAFLARVVEVRAMVYCGLVRGRAAEDRGAPRVEVGVEVEYGDGAVDAVDGAEQGERDSVVAAERDQPWVRLAGLGEEAGGAGVGVGGAREEEVVAFFDLLDGVGVVVAGPGWS